MLYIINLTSFATLTRGRIYWNYTELTLPCQRFSFHVQNRTIKQRSETEHKCKLILKLFTINTNKIAGEQIRFKLAIKKVIFIKNLNPILNKPFNIF